MTKFIFDNLIFVFVLASAIFFGYAFNYALTYSNF